MRQACLSVCRSPGLQGSPQHLISRHTCFLHLQKCMCTPSNNQQILFQVNKFPHTVGGLQHETISILLLVHIMSQLIQFHSKWKNTPWLTPESYNTFICHIYFFTSCQQLKIIEISTGITMAPLQIYELTTNLRKYEAKGHLYGKPHSTNPGSAIQGRAVPTMELGWHLGLLTHQAHAEPQFSPSALRLKIIYFLICMPLNMKAEKMSGPSQMRL